MGCPAGNIITIINSIVYRSKRTFYIRAQEMRVREEQKLSITITSTEY